LILFLLTYLLSHSPIFHGTGWPTMFLSVVKKLLTHSPLRVGSLVMSNVLCVLLSG